MRKRVISLLLTVIMIIGMFPVNVYADGPIDNNTFMEGAAETTPQEPAPDTQQGQSGGAAEPALIADQQSQPQDQQIQPQDQQSQTQDQQAQTQDQQSQPQDQQSQTQDQQSQTQDQQDQFQDQQDQTQDQQDQTQDQQTEEETEERVMVKAPKKTKNENENQPAVTADAVAELFRALPDASSITENTTEEERIAIMAQLQAAMDALNNLSDNYPEEFEIFVDRYADLYFAADELNSALVNNVGTTYANVAYNPGSGKNVTITVTDDEGEPVTNATITVTRDNNNYVVQYLENGRYAFSRNSTSSFTNYEITVSAVGYNTATKHIIGSTSSVVIILEKSVDLSQENWQDFNVFYIATGKLPDSYAGAGDASDYGPGKNNTPLVTVRIDINKLRREYSNVALYEEGKEGNQYYFIPVGAHGDETAIANFWNAVQDCMHSDSKSAFENTGLYGDFSLYVLKKQGDGSQHADGVLTVTPPVYLLELYDGTTLFSSSVSDQNKVNFKDRATVLEEYEDQLAASRGASNIEWDAQWAKDGSITGVYATETDAYTVKVSQTDYASSIFRPDGTDIGYKVRSANAFYIAQFNVEVTVGAEGYYSVVYNDGIDTEEVFPDRRFAVAAGGSTPTFGETDPTRPGYTFAGWTLDGADGTHAGPYTTSDVATQFPTVTNDLYFHAEWKLIPTEFLATVEVYLNNSYLSDITDMLRDANAELYIKAENSTEYYNLTETAVNGVYSAMVPNGTYYTYYSTDGGHNYTQTDTRNFVILNNEGSRILHFNSVIYDLNGGTTKTEIVSPEYHRRGSEVNVTDTVPTREGYIFQGWKCGDKLYQRGEELTSFIETPYVLTAQWVRKINVTVNVIIEHGDDDTVGKDNVNFSLVELRDGISHHLGLSKNLTRESHAGYDLTSANDNNNKPVCTYTASSVTFSDLPEATYRINCFKSGYTNSVEITVEEQTGDQTITLTLKYSPEYFTLNFKVQMEMDENGNVIAPVERRPYAVRIKAVRWVKDHWEVATQHENVSALVVLDENGEGSGKVNVAKYYPGEAENILVDYRIIVTSYIMPDKISTVEATQESYDVFNSNNGIYSGVVTIEDGGRTVSANGSVIPTAYAGAYNIQDGMPTATISVNAYSVTFVANTVNGATVKGKTEDTVSGIITIPALEGYEPVHSNANYIFDGWYSQDGSRNNDWGEKVVAGTYLSGDIRVYAKWKEPLTVTGTVYVSAVYEDETGPHTLKDDRIVEVPITLDQNITGGHAQTQYVEIKYTGDLGVGTYRFENVPDNGHFYFVNEIAAGYSSTFQNEPDSLNEDKKTNFAQYYDTDDNFANRGTNDPQTAVVNVYLEFNPQHFDLQYDVDASAIGESFRPDTVELLLTAKGASHDPNPANWNVIPLMVNGGDVLRLVDGKASGSSSVWTTRTDGTTPTQYGLNVGAITGLGSCTVNTLPYSVSYQAPAYHVSGGQSKQLKATITPNKYAITYDLGINETAVTGMENAPKEHTWSFDTDLSTLKPTRMGYEFKGWYDNAQFNGERVEKIDASVSEEVTLYAKWLQVLDRVNLTVHIDHTYGENGKVSSYDKILEVWLTGRPDGSGEEYENIPGRFMTYADWHDEENHGATTETFSVPDIFTKLPSDWEYSLNVILDSYYVDSKNVTTTTDEYGVTTYDVVVQLRYRPDMLNLTVNGLIDPRVPKENWPVSAVVKISCWYPVSENTIDWHPISQHKASALTITFDENGLGNVTYPVWQWENKTENRHYHYRMEVAELKLKDGTVISMSDVKEQENVLYSGGNYLAEIVTEGCTAPKPKEIGSTTLPGAYGELNNDVYEQVGTVTAVISADFWKDNIPDHQQAKINFVSEYPYQGLLSFDGVTNAAKLEKVYDLTEAVDGKVTLPKVQVSAAEGYEFSHWTNDNDETVTLDWSDEANQPTCSIPGGKEYTYTAHWIPVEIGYTVKFLDNSGNSISEDVLDEEGYKKTVHYDKHLGTGIIVYDGINYVFDYASPESITIGLDSDENVITLYYAKDEDRDGYADYKQIFVKFESGVNGSVGETNREQAFSYELNHGDEDITRSYTPAKVEITPAAGYKFESWTMPNGTTSTDENAPFSQQSGQCGKTYTYTVNWTKRNDYSYTVQYLELLANGEEKKLLEDKVVNSVEFEKECTEDFVVINGFYLNTELSGGQTKNFKVTEDNMVIKFYYDRRTDLTLTVKYREIVDNTETDTKIHDDIVQKGFAYEAEPKLDVFRTQIDGFEYVKTDPESVRILESGQEVTLYYKRVSYGYTVKYFYDKKEEATLEYSGTHPYNTTLTHEDYGKEKIPAKPKSGFTLSHIDGIPLNIGTNPEYNIIYVHYASDSNADGVPDEYQAFVNFKVQDGTWMSSGDDANTYVLDPGTNQWIKVSEFGSIVGKKYPLRRVFTLYEWDTENNSIKKKDAPMLGTLPTGKNDEHYLDDGGKWDHGHLNNGTEHRVTEKTAEYVLNFQPKKYTLTVVVENGTSDLGSRSLNAIEFFYDPDASTTVRFAPNPNHILDAVYIDGEYVSATGGNGFIFEKEDGQLTEEFSNVFSKTFKHTASHLIRVVYKPDINGDGIIDEYQATVTFDVVNGTWISCGTEQLNGVTTYVKNYLLKNRDTDPQSQTYGQLISLNPVVGSYPQAEANAGYTQHLGVWDKPFDENTVVKDNAVVYTYSYTKENQYTISVITKNGTAKANYTDVVKNEQNDDVGRKFEDIDVSNAAYTVTHHEDHEEYNSVLTFAPNTGYILDRAYLTVKNGDGTYVDTLIQNFSGTHTFDHKGDHTITVVYAEDKNNNKIPDNAEILITYKIVDGKWLNEQNEPTDNNDIVKSYSNKNADGTYSKPTSVTLTENDVPRGTPNPGFDPNSAKWEPVELGNYFNDKESLVVERSMTFVLSYTLNNYFISAVVEGGTAKEGNVAFADHDIYHSASNRTVIDFAPTVESGTLEAVLVDEHEIIGVDTFRNLTSETEYSHPYATSNKVTVDTDGNVKVSLDNLSNHHVKVVYAQDTNNDKIPDKYQKKVTFIVENGAFTDGTGSVKSNVLNLKNDNGKYDINGKAILNAPDPATKMSPATGYVRDKAYWLGYEDASLPTEVHGLNDEIFTYRFITKQQIKEVIKVDNGVSWPVESISWYEYDEAQHVIRFTPNEGYTLDYAEVKLGNASEYEKPIPLVEYTDKDGITTPYNYLHNHTQDLDIHVVFAKDEFGDDNIPDYQQAKINFVSENSDRGLLSFDGGKQAAAIEKVYNLTDAVNGEVPLPEVIVSPVTGYRFDHWTDEKGKNVILDWSDEANQPKCSISGGEEHTYTAHWVPEVKNYTVEYRDEFGAAIPGYPAKQGSKNFGETVTAESEKITIDDYIFLSANVPSITIGVNENENVIVLTYGLDKWKDTIDANDSDTGGDGVPDSKQALFRFESAESEKGSVVGKYRLQVFTFDTVKVVTPAIPELEAVYGYMPDYWTEFVDGNEITLDPFVSTVVSGGMERTFMIHWTESNEMPVIINHLDLSGNRFYTEKAKGTYMAEFGYENYKDYVFEKGNQHLPVGYVFAYADPESITVTTGSNVINLYYDMDSNGDTKPDYRQAFVKFHAAEGGQVIGLGAGNTVQAFDLDMDENGKYVGNVIPIMAADATDAELAKGVLAIPDSSNKMVVDYWSYNHVHTTSVNPFKEWPVRGGQTLEFTVHFAKDEIGGENGGDNVPDKYQARVTYKIVEGYWDNTEDNSEKLAIFDLWNNNADTGWIWERISPEPTLGNTIPDVTKAKPAEGYTTSGHWGNEEAEGETSDDPTADTVVYDGAVYTYSFSHRIPYTVKVDVTNGGFTVGEDETVQQQAEFERVYDDRLELRFAPAEEEGKNYVLESVTVNNNAATLEDVAEILEGGIRDNYTINVVYGNDVWSEDPSKPSDGISDNFQIKVTYSAKPPQFGSVSLLSKARAGAVEGSAVVSEVHTIRDADGKLAKEGYVQLNGAQALVKAGDENGDNVFMGWTGGIVALTADSGTDNEPAQTTIVPELGKVSGGSEYNYYANFQYKMKIKAVYFVEHYLWDDVQRRYVLDEDATLTESGYVGETVTVTEPKDYAGYALNTIASELSGVISMPSGQNKVEPPTGLLTLKLFYDKDSGGDDVPDIFQKKVIFRVVNGTWRHASLEAGYAVRERVEWLTLYDENGQPSPNGKATLTRPTDMKPDRGFAYGKWNQIPPAEVSGTDTEVYTYTYYSIWTPKTGDDSNIPMWLGFMGLSLAGMLGTAFGFKRKKRGESK